MAQQTIACRCSDRAALGPRVPICGTANLLGAAQWIPDLRSWSDGNRHRDATGAFIAYFAIILLRNKSRLAVPLAWLLALETLYDTVSNIRGGVSENLMGAASGITWLTLVFFVPMVVVRVLLLLRQLYARRSEAIDSTSSRN
jgi:hypothetical protein